MSNSHCISVIVAHIFSCRTQLYGLVWDLHKVGIVHGDLEPQNVARVSGGGLRLLDFSHSARHTCEEILVRNMVAPS